MFTKTLCTRSAVRCSWRSAPAMPLRAKIINPALAVKAQMAFKSTSAASKTDSGMVNDDEDVLFDSLYGLRTIELNRPNKLHSLNGSMIEKIVPRLQEWEKSDMANVVIIKGSGEKAFCAGGDVTHLAKQNLDGPEGQKKSADYFASEYRLDHLIATYQKPYVAVMDGITMGGGVGLSVHAPIRIATEKTVFAMPETTIGFFPDVGASFFLPRMPGGLGTYLALTSDKLKGVNVYYAGIATHYIHSTSLPALERRLAELRFKDYLSLDERLHTIDSTIEEYATGLPHDEPMLLSGKHRQTIDRVFGDNVASIPEVIAELVNSPGDQQEWAQKTLKTLKQRSPTAVHVTFRQMKLGKKWSIKETFEREHQIATKFMKHPDFTEGVHALLIRKDGKPKWEYEQLQDVEKAQKIKGQDITDDFFLVEGDRLLLLNDRDYQEYPHLKYGLPSERQIEKVVRDAKFTVKEIVNHFVKETRGKQGVQQVVHDVLQRKTHMEHGIVAWGPQARTLASEA
ncbi:mitochondrial 3-hydroxyisobutyryl-CoA hydrolase-like protein [Amylocarpus encephaloides]|uniref:3-hydroxyisobutyryl-CoA hydrolase n=1 Tax=Amylocarpus encephaloides TaxID=45428 RepID=A0A9P8C4B6_9HELO|nr:mitochondrial 3-hydroxyisobutyryl-CoA hydrolase-like protein [Amylocarpus encephaloides]